MLSSVHSKDLNTEEVHLTQICAANLCKEIKNIYKKVIIFELQLML